VKRAGPTQSGKDHTPLCPEINSIMSQDYFLQTISIHSHWSSNRRRIDFIVSPRFAFDCFLDRGLYVLGCESSSVENSLGGGRNWGLIRKSRDVRIRSSGRTQLDVAIVSG